MKSPDTMSREELEEEVAFLRSELGFVEDTGQVGALCARYGFAQGPAVALLALYNAGGKTLGAVQIENAVGAAGRDRDYDNIVSVYICRLRKALGRDAIKTVWGRGYHLTPAGLAAVSEVVAQR